MYLIKATLAAQTEVLNQPINRLSKKIQARAFNTQRPPQNQARYQYSAEFTSVFQ